MRKKGERRQQGRRERKDIRREPVPGCGGRGRGRKRVEREK